ncbi:calcium/calmodulin-regulated receptor-like kinase 2 isoform X2 [Iris pallida]|uniref:Calcium/calmodulin-regulated receptor-like kinase 2 isoform X2 n=1 Tax=Iris pallida TaxID=29817 RepID=A0AAX6FCV4_IRIPA|nr:calcium/calmodulin-regulated receptor-like kinase 2 isoform X2 [Iris pallida]
MPTNEVVAVKVLANNSKQGEREFHTEVLLLSRLHHKNLVNLLGYCVDKGQRMLIYEFMSNGSLDSLLYGDGKRNLSWEERLLIALDISRGIEYLHEGAVPPVVHRDLKSANILLDKSMSAKVADFGLSKEEVSDGRKSTLKGTHGYMDPDYVSSNKYTKKSDVYSFGIILFELITAINPQQGLMDYINLAGIGGNEKADWDEIVDSKLTGKSNPDEVRLLADIAYRCLHKTPKKRPSMADVTVAISRITRRSLTKEDTMMRSLDSFGILKRIELQHVEMNKLTSIKESPVIV